MEIGYFIRLGDKTSCGGTVVSATSHIVHHGLNLARLGDKVTCGKNGGVFSLLGGIHNYTCNGLPCIGTLESFSGCPCQSRLFASEFSSSYYPEPPKVINSRKKFSQEPVQHTQAAKKKMVPEPEPTFPPKEGKLPREPVDAGFCIVDLPANVKDFGDNLFYNPIAGARELYDSLNGSGPIKPASILLLVDPDKQDPKQIEILKKAKTKIDNALSNLTMEEASLLHKHKDAIDAFTGVGSGIIGAASEAGGRYFEEIEKILKEIQQTYKSAYITRGALIGEQFYVERAMHFKKLNLLLNNFMKYKLGMSEYSDLRRALGLSSRSIMRHWSQTGVTDIEGYATYIEKSARLIKAMKKLGYVGITLDFVNTTNTIYDACTVGRESECKRITVVEYSKFAGSQVGGLIGGAIGSRLSSAACVWGLGLLTSEIGGAGALLCSAVAITGGLAGGEVSGSMGGDIGSVAGQVLYEAFSSE